jgi:pimeloyl-ACP methyl ester carboxylesterase
VDQASTPIRRDLPGSGIRLSALQWAPDAAAEPPPILLHHGLASSAGFWGPVASRLATGIPSGACREVVALDARGHGESDRPDDGFDFATIAADLHGALAALGWDGVGGTRPVLVGHSWGGNVVLEYAALHPDVPAGIVLVDGGFIELQAHMSWEETEQELAPPRLTSMTWREFSERAAGWWSATGWDASVEAAVRHNFEELPDGTIRSRLSRERHMRILRAMWEQRPSELYERVRCPVLLLPARRANVEGREQRFIEQKERTVERARAILRHAGTQVVVEWFEDSIHDVPLQHPARLAARLQAFAAGLPVAERRAG